jgi:hypothetical protein
MANTHSQKGRGHDTGKKHRRMRPRRGMQARLRRRARTRGPLARLGRRIRPEMSAVRTNLGRAGENVRRIGANLRQASGHVLEASGAVPELAREAGERLGEVASRGGERLGEVASEARERLTQTALEARGMGIRLLRLPDVLREVARRGVETLEAAGMRAVASVIQAGTRGMKTARLYVTDLSFRRRVDHRALEDLVVEQLRWAHTGVEAIDRAAAEVEDDEMRMRLVRCKLQMIRQAEALTQLVRNLGASVPVEERGEPPAPAIVRNGARGPAAARQGLAYVLTIAVQNAEGWSALGRIGALAASEAVADAITRATGSIGREPEEQVQFVRAALLETTLQTVLVGAR